MVRIEFRVLPDGLELGSADTVGVLLRLQIDCIADRRELPRLGIGTATAAPSHIEYSFLLLALFFPDLDDL